jgi:hypothetical protein
MALGAMTFGAEPIEAGVSVGAAGVAGSVVVVSGVVEGSAGLLSQAARARAATIATGRRTLEFNAKSPVISIGSHCHNREMAAKL